MHPPNLAGTLPEITFASRGTFNLYHLACIDQQYGTRYAHPGEERKKGEIKKLQMQIEISCLVLASAIYI